jgi:hypothetical protein
MGELAPLVLPMIFVVFHLFWNVVNALLFLMGCLKVIVADHCWSVGVRIN